MTDAEAEAWLNHNYFPDPRELRSLNRAGLGTMAAAAMSGNIPMLEWLCGKGVGDLINSVSTQSRNETPPLVYAIVSGREPAARWLLEHGADPCPLLRFGDVLHCSCRHMSAGFVSALCDRIPPERLDLDQVRRPGNPTLVPSSYTPLRLAQSNPDPQPMLELLILRGARVSPSFDEWPACFHRRQQRLVAWLEHELGIADTFLALLGCGVHDTTQVCGWGVYCYDFLLPPSTSYYS